MGIIKYRLFHPDETHVLEARTDGSYFIQSGLAGFYVKDLRCLVDLYELLEEEVIGHDVEEYFDPTTTKENVRYTKGG